MRQIDVDAIIKLLQNRAVQHDTGGDMLLAIECVEIIREIEQMPTVDMAAAALRAHQPKRGRWIKDSNGVIICSECGAEHEWLDYRASFCEDCGAQMDMEAST